jgi:hypothetical protein
VRGDATRIDDWIRKQPEGKYMGSVTKWRKKKIRRHKYKKRRKKLKWQRRRR